MRLNFLSVKNRFIIFLSIALFFSAAALSQSTAPESTAPDILLQKLQTYNKQKAARGENSSSLQDTVKAWILIDIIARDHLDRPESSLRYCNELETLSAEIAYNRGLAKANELKAAIYDNLRKYDKALYYNKVAQSFYYKENGYGSIDVYNNMGIVYSKLGIYNEALKYHLKSLGLAENTGDVFGLVSSYNNIGVLYISLHRYDEALNYYLKCLKIQLTRDKGLYIAETYQNIGELYRLKKQFGNALKFLEKGISAATYEDQNTALCNCYSTMSQVYADMGQYQKALVINEKAYSLRQKINDGYGLFTSLCTFVTIYHKLGENNKALSFAEKALKHLEGHGELDMHKEAHRQLAQVNAALGNYKAAYTNHELYKKYSDSIFNAENQKKLVEQQMNFDFNKKEALAKEALQRQKAIRNYTIGGLAALGLFVILFLVRRHRRKSLEKKTEYEKGIVVLQDELDIKEIETELLKVDNENIQLKNSLIAAEHEILGDKFEHNKRELASMMLYASQKNEMLAGLKSEVDDFREGRVTAAQIEKIKSVINQNLHLDADWDKFRLHFEQVHPDFFAQLKQDHPTLTAYEVRLYTYLHMQLSTKEIAMLLNITPASVIKAKMRLNKKLNSTEDNPQQTGL